MDEKDYEKYMPKEALSCTPEDAETSTGKDVTEATGESSAAGDELLVSPYAPKEYQPKEGGDAEATETASLVDKDPEADSTTSVAEGEAIQEEVEDPKENESLESDDTSGDTPSRQVKSRFALFLPIVVALSLLLGFYMGWRQGGKGLFSYSANSHSMKNVTPEMQDKLWSVMSLIQNEYVDELSPDTLIEMSIRGLMNSLDPHSLYISKDDLESTKEDLEGDFSGVGVSFLVYDDSIVVVSVIPGGPAAKVGLQRGDRILSADTVVLNGKSVTSDLVYSTLRGAEGSKVALKVKRPGKKGVFTFNVVRGQVPVSSVDAYYVMDDKKTGYVKLSRFASNTYDEVFQALTELKNSGAKQYMIDLRGNTGGYMDQAILIANEFLKEGEKIVYTKGRCKENEMAPVADGLGSFQNVPLTLLVDENSASASEILAGAIQDNDRGIIVGRRTFGKGLVQNQFEIPSGGALRLTVARYYTPSGRSIQKEYKLGEKDDYNDEVWSRYARGELFNADSIKIDKSHIYFTTKGRKVYGGGGIMPDFFVAEDTTSYTPYYIKAVNSGCIQNFAFKIADNYRSLLKNAKTDEQVLHIIPADSRLISAFAEYAEQKGLPAQWYYINMSRDMLLTKIRAFILRYVLTDNDFYKVYNSDDKTVIKAQQVLSSGVLPKEPQLH